MNRISKIAIISGIVAVVIIGMALTVHFRLSETEKSEVQSGAEQKENESPSDVANEILNSLQNKTSSEQNESGESSESGSEQNENASPADVANQILTSLQNKTSSEQNESGEQSESNEQNESGEQAVTVSKTDQINMIVQKIDGIYRWSNSLQTNPEITLKIHMVNPIKLTNPTDTKHAFVIEQNGTLVYATKDLEPGKSGIISLKPAHVGVFDYHCKYHPDTMKGTLNVIS